MSTDDVWESQNQTQIKACIQILWMGKWVLFFSLPFFFWMHQSAQEEMSESNSFHLFTNKQGNTRVFTVQQFLLPVTQ